MNTLRKTMSRLVANPIFLGALTLCLAVGAIWMKTGTVQILTFVLITAMFAMSINVLTGLAGQISLGHAGFFGAGAYGSGIMAKTYGLDIVVAIPLGSLMAGLLGYLVSFPAGRVREVYLAMMTLGFGMIFYEVVREWSSVTGGNMGFSGVPSAALRTVHILGMPLNQVGYFWLVLIVAVLLIWLLANMTKSDVGRSLLAVHHNEMAAGSMGISKVAMKRLGYVLSGLIAGLAGAFYAHLVGYLGPDSFGINRSIEVLVVSIVGGLGSIAGQILSATLFTFLPEMLQSFAEYQFIVYGLILTVSLFILPKGIAGLVFEPPRYISRKAIDLSKEADKTLRWNDRAGSTALKVEDLTMRFGGLTALDNVSVTLEPGKITALVGPNGSGKSTLVNVICGIYKPTHGHVLLDGREISGLHDFKVAEQGVIRTFQDPRLVPGFTVRENLILGAHRLIDHSGLAAAFGLPSSRAEEARLLACVEAVMEMTNLSEHADVVVSELPYGHTRMAEVARCLMARPHTVLLDEPAAGLSEVEMAMLASVIRKMKEHGLTVLLIDHHMDFLADLVDDVLVFDAGKVIYRGTIDGMRRDAGVIKAYLGDAEVAA